MKCAGTETPAHQRPRRGSRRRGSATRGRGGSARGSDPPRLYSSRQWTSGSTSVWVTCTPRGGICWSSIQRQGCILHRVADTSTPDHHRNRYHRNRYSCRSRCRLHRCNWFRLRAVFHNPRDSYIGLHRHRRCRHRSTGPIRNRSRSCSCPQHPRRSGRRSSRIRRAYRCNRSRHLVHRESEHPTGFDPSPSPQQKRPEGFPVCTPLQSSGHDTQSSPLLGSHTPLPHAPPTPLMQSLGQL